MSGLEPDFITLDGALYLHRRSLELFGGLDGIRDPMALDSALAAARNAYYYQGGDIYDIAAAYAFHIAESQAFLDGNKRTAVACALVFIGRPAPDQLALYDAMIAIARRELDKPGLASLLRGQFEARDA